MTAAFRCARTSLVRDDQLLGTASTVRAFLLVENPGPWGVDALHDARLPPPVKQALRQPAHEARVRVLLVRRHHREAPRHQFRVFAAYADPAAPWAETTILDDPEQLLELDLAGLGAGRSIGLDRHARPVFAVCTHGRHDACCAEQGRPAAAALAAARPEDGWEISHIGGDRFAGNMIVFPDGLYYGRIDAAAAISVTGSHLAGELDLDHLRGRSGYRMPVQAAEILLRRDLAETRNDALRLVSARVVGEETEAVFAVGAASYQVTVRTTHGPATAQLTCRATRDNPLPRHELLGVRRIDA
ncbi:sucrase ferredoxin [Nocardioides speluncae]|uniref:sucrase ferredoxin n=1 Tax=Nocardioides speluncae TaxID=2670337 RepID=UPI000D6908CB|nr:sucrase ferredoxin [Nocardioides speluncae]